MPTTSTTTTPVTTDDLVVDLATQPASDAYPLLHRYGAVILRGIMPKDLCAQMVERVDQIFAEPNFQRTRNVKGGQGTYGQTGIVVHRLFELDPMFRDNLVREPIISIAEDLLGERCHCIAQGCILNRPGKGINRFHVDDDVEFPISGGMDEHDPRLQMPLLRMSVQIALTDQDEVQYGPSEVVPGSNRSGQNPDDPENPSFKGQGPVPLLMKAGDCYLMNGQSWHRGHPNTSDRVRYLLHQVYGQRCMAQIFWPYLNYHMPPHVLEDVTDERLLRVLGKHTERAYG